MNENFRVGRAKKAIAAEPVKDRAFRTKYLVAHE